MRFKPKEILVNLPAVHMFASEEEVSDLATSFNTFIHGKVKMKYEIIGILSGKVIGLFYMQRNSESQQLRDKFVKMIQSEEIQPLVEDFDFVEDAIEEKNKYQQYDNQDTEYYSSKILSDQQIEYDPEYGNDRLCLCGHTYYRHFDSHAKMAYVGCKYCNNYGNEHVYERNCPFFVVEKPE